MLPDWLALGLAIVGLLSIAFAALFLIGERYFPAPAVRTAATASGEWKRRREIRAYLDAIDEPYQEDLELDGESPAFYLPDRDVAITFDAHAYFRLEAAGRYGVLVEHEMPGVHLGTRLPFETPSVGGTGATGGRRSPAAGRRRTTTAAGRGAADVGPGDARSRWAHVGTNRESSAGGAATGERATTADEAAAMTVRDALAVLGVDVGGDPGALAGADRTVDVDPETLRAAYRTRIKEAHPDQGGDVDEFERVQDAYATARRAI